LSYTYEDGVSLFEKTLAVSLACTTKGVRQAFRQLETGKPLDIEMVPSKAPPARRCGTLRVYARVLQGGSDKISLLALYIGMASNIGLHQIGHDGKAPTT
jgi:hypothetical protein